MWEREERLMLVMSRNREHELEIIRQMAYGRQVDGFIIQHSGEENGEQLDLLLRSERPFVVMGGTPRPGVNTASFDMRSFAADIAESLRGCAGVVLVLPGGRDGRTYSPFLDYFADWRMCSWSRTGYP